jgi:hypothetical protein
MNDSEDNPYRPPAEPLESRPLVWSAPTVDTAHAMYMAGEFTWADCRRACRLMFPHRTVARVWLVVAGLVALFLLAQSFAERGGAAPTAWALAVAGAVLFGAVPAMVGWFRFEAARQTWRNVKDTPVRRWVSEIAIRTDTPRISTIEAWPTYERHVRSDQLVLLSGRSSGGYLMFPRSHCLSDSDWNAFVALVESKTRRA